MEDPRRLTEAQYEKMEKALEERIQEAGPVEFHRFSNHLGEIWAAMRPDGNGGFAVGFALCNPMDKSMPRRYRRWKGRHISLSRLVSERRPVSITVKPPIEEDGEKRNRAIREVITAQLFNEMRSATDPLPPKMFGVREYRGDVDRSAFRTWIRKFVDKLYNDIQVAKYRAEDAAKAEQPA